MLAPATVCALAYTCRTKTRRPLGGGHNSDKTEPLTRFSIHSSCHCVGRQAPLNLVEGFFVRAGLRPLEVGRVNPRRTEQSRDAGMACCWGRVQLLKNPADWLNGEVQGLAKTSIAIRTCGLAFPSRLV